MRSRTVEASCVSDGRSGEAMAEIDGRDGEEEKRGRTRRCGVGRVEGTKADARFIARARWAPDMADCDDVRCSAGDEKDVKVEVGGSHLSNKT